MRRLIPLFFALLVFMAGCMDGEVCRSPYVEYKKGECCLDVNGNNICDSDEATTTLTTTTIVRVTTTRTATTTTLTPLSEQPDEATFRKYFSEMGLGRLPSGGNLPGDVEENVNVFSPEDQICHYGVVVREVQPSTAYYDVEAGDYVAEKMQYPRPLQRGGFAGCGSLNIPPGKYEYKVYVDNVLVAVLPFEVQ